MKFSKFIIMCTFAFILSLSTVQAEPKNGFGFYGGITSSSMDIKFDDSPGTYKCSSSGLSLGIDYQFAITDYFSINPIWMSSSESPGGDFDNSVEGIGHGVFALQLLFWVGDIYMGGHFGNYSEVIISENSTSGTITSTGAGSGYGLVVGYKIKDNIFVNLQTDQAKINYSNAETDLQTVRLQVGYRWN